MVNNPSVAIEVAAATARVLPAETPPVPEQMVYDAAHQVIVFVDPTQHAADTSKNTMDTWIWTGTTWTRLTPADSPSPRDGYGLAYDTSRSITVLAGGWGFSAEETSTWGWNGKTWSRIG